MHELLLLYIYMYILFFFSSIIKLLWFCSLWLHILSCFLGIWLASVSPVFNANTFVSDIKNEYKPTVLPYRWMWYFNISWNYFYSAFHPLNATKHHSNGNYFQGQWKLPYMGSLSSPLTVLTTFWKCLNVCLKSFLDDTLNVVCDNYKLQHTNPKMGYTW